MSVVANVAVNVDARNATQQLRGLQSQAQQTQNAFGQIGGAVTKLASAFALLQGAKFVFAKTAELESQTKSLQVLTGSVQQAKQIIAELQQLGAVTPFTSTELIDAAKRLQAFGVEANNVVETTRRLADASGATGAELQGLVTAYGQVQAKGRLQGEELLQFQERGIALQEELRKMYGMTGEEFQKALQKGQITAKAVEVALQRLTSVGGKYANGAIAQSDTLNGKLSTLQDGVDALARRLGQALTPALKAIFNQAIAVVDAINAALAAGRGGGLTRNVFGARQALNVGATSQAVDNIAKGIGQINNQKNRAGINQNLQALQQYQRLLQSVGSTDPNANRAVKLQGVILQKIDQNLKAQKQFQAGAKQTEKIFQTPALGVPTAGGGGGGGGGGKAAKGKTAKEIEDISSKELDLRLQIGIAQQQQNEAQEAYLAKQLAILTINQQEIGPNEKKAQIYEAVVEYAEKLRQIEEKQSKETLPAYVAELASAAAGYSDVLYYSKQLTEEQKQQKVLSDGITGAIGQGMTSAFDALIQGSEDFGSSLRRIASGVLMDIAKQLLQIFVIEQAISALRGVLGGGGGGFGGGANFNPAAFGMESIVPGLSGIGNFFGGARANGGSVMGSKGYIVGERGPELFVPNSSGTIIPNDRLGGGGDVSVTVNVDASGSNVQGDQGQAKALGAAVSAAVQAEIVKQQRPGGLLAGTR